MKLFVLMNMWRTYRGWQLCERLRLAFLHSCPKEKTSSSTRSCSKTANSKLAFKQANKISYFPIERKFFYDTVGLPEFVFCVDVLTIVLCLNIMQKSDILHHTTMLAVSLIKRRLKI